MIDRGDIRQQSTVAAISGLHCRALVMVSSSIRLTAWLQNSKKRAERSERLMYEQSHRDYLRSGYSHHRLPVSGLLIITVITPLPTKPSATKTPENWAGERGNYWHADASAWCCCARCKIHEGELADAKAGNDVLRKDVAAGRRRLHISSLSVSAWSYYRLRIMQPPRLADTAEGDYFTLERLITMQKQLEGTQKYINEQCR